MLLRNLFSLDLLFLYVKRFLDVSNDLASTSSNEISNYDFHLKPSSVLKRQSIEKMVKEYCARYQNDDVRSKIKKKKVRKYYKMS